MPGCTGLCQAIQGCAGLYGAVPGCAVPCWAVLGYTGLYRAHRRSLAVIQAHHGEAAAGTHQREPGAAEDADPGRAEKRREFGAFWGENAKSEGFGGEEDKGLTAAVVPQSSRHSKLEKADILEMTVKHLRNLQRAQMTGEHRASLPSPFI